ncbi:type II secretion system protein [Homoserinimonas sp. OAct 916]|uniref:type IV pilus modification PilV family protein n=1 Tax=Homoserinimonas sp. OAct 916 TaxID=2211450 RepID=UPI000DBE5FD1|nr:type II secretion system protein [Homoserinimonas sp. OAct 916]
MKSTLHTKYVSENGFGMIEIIVSMFLIALLAVAFIPLLIQTLQVSVTNTTVATATQLVSDGIEGARAQGDTCATLQLWRDEVLTPTIDDRGVSLQPERTLSCPAAYPGVAEVTVTVAETGHADSLASAVSLIFVKAAV